MNETRLKVGSLVAHWRRDTRGTSMVTTAMTMPVFIVLLAGIWSLYVMLAHKAALHNGVQDAAHYISENARYWPVDPSGNAGIGGDLLPADFYEMQARRMIESRIRDVAFYSSQTITDNLTVKVEEPLLAYAPDASQEPLPEGNVDDGLCNPKSNQPGDYRYYKNTRFRVYAVFKVPIFQVRLPYYGAFDVTLSDRAIGYVECPRWRGKREADNYDKSKMIGAEGPYVNFRFLSTPLPVIPTVTEAVPTPVPSVTPTPP